MTPFRTIACFLAVAICPIAPADAQETRAESLRQQREKKQQAAKPYDPNAVERLLKAIERGGVPFLTRDGIYAKLGSLTTGSGFAYGGGYRTNRLGERTAN